MLRDVIGMSKTATQPFSACSIICAKINKVIKNRNCRMKIAFFSFDRLLLCLMLVWAAF